MKSLVVIFAVLLVGIIFIFIWEFSSKPTLASSNYNEISWRLPLDKEIQKMGESFLYSEIDLCTDYFIKKFEGEKYLIACNSGNGAWTYYTAYAGQKKVYLTPSEFTSTLIPPQIPGEQPQVKPIKHNSRNSRITENKQSSPETNLSR